MTPVVARQRGNRLDPHWIKLTAEVRAAGFRSGTSHTIEIGGGEYEFRPFPKGRPFEKLDHESMRRILARRGYTRVAQLTGEWSKRYQPLLNRIKNDGCVPRIPQ